MKALNINTKGMLPTDSWLGGVGVCWENTFRVPLPLCAVSCIQAHYPPPGLEEEFEFVGFKYANE